MARPHHVTLRFRSGAAAERFVEWATTCAAIEPLTGCTDVEVEDVTPCDAVLNYGPGHQSRSRCQVEGEHEDYFGHPVHGALIMGAWHEWYVDTDGLIMEPGL